ncbi:RNA-directed DNA polymerase from mobile element jockey [Araneus ventricosus]|uniref:RNA-directed DNA polymerase from mobile element jockey n=1 Tax=Araneus ventricosus TaxID=182803 RepID=A0A4Y2MRI4_ARAVE|nr:RNA-directed DNA polymerase from mobile element jockey [Araneus ventricosus]
MDRQGRPGGGLLTAIPKNASGRIIPTGFSHNFNQEILAVEVHFKDFHFIIINLYAPQGLNIDNVKYFFDSFSIPVFIFGDFNLHHPFWGSNRSSPLSNDFVEWLQNSSFILLNSSNPTYAAYTGSASLLDLSICSASISHAVDCYVSESNFESDHYPVIITWSILDHTPKKIKSIDWNRIMSNSATVLNTNTRLNALTSKISEVIRNNTKIMTLPAKNYPPWWNLSCHNFQKLKIFFRKRALRLISESDWMKHKKYAAKLRFHIKKASRNYWDKICNITKNPRMFYSMLNRIYNHTNQEINTVNLILHNNHYISNPVQQSNLFADFFSDNSMKHEPIPLDYCEDCNPNLNIPIHIQEVRQAIQKTRNSTPGADGITANWFKRLSNTDLICITSFFQEVFTTSYIPEEWKHSIIVPIPKPNKDKTKINSYRPIALTSVFSKVFERILIQRITHHLLTEKKIPPSVNGFLPLRDNQLAVYKIHTAISEAHSHRKYFIGISLDIKSAYDTVYIDGLIFKCLQLGITGNITKILHNFLQNRTLQVRWRNSLSGTKPVQKGLPQGSVVSPILFVCFLADFSETLDVGVEYSIFADDIFIFCAHTSLDHISKKLQNTMENVYKWCNYWKLNISPEKCSIADLSKKKLPSIPRITYAGFPLPWKQTIKYLGINFSKINQNGIILQNIRSKALRKINALKSIAYKNYGPRTKDLINIVNNSICSLFYYSCSITNKFSETQYKACNTIQTMALRVALGLPKWTPNIVLMKIAGQEVLSEKIKRLAAQFFIRQLANGVHSPIYDQNCNPSIKLIKRDEVMLTTLFTELDTSTDHIIAFPDTLISRSNFCEIFLSDFSFQNKAHPAFLIKDLFEEVVYKEFQDYHIIATDASKSHSFTSIAGISNLQSFVYRIHPINSIFTAEALAICQALDELSVTDKNLLLLTDSYSVLQALKCLTIKSPKVIHRLAGKILVRKNFHQKISLVWTPGHSLIHWNEKADLLAKTVTESHPLLEWIAYEDIISRYQTISLQKTNISFQHSKYQESIGDIPAMFTLTPWLKNRREDIIIARLLTRMIITPALLHRFGLHNYPRCQICNRDNNIEHIILFCSKYSNHRSILYAKLNFDPQLCSSLKAFFQNAVSDKRHLRILLQSLKSFDIY